MTEDQYGTALYLLAGKRWMVYWNFDDFPDHPTQGETLEELETMLKDLYECLELSKFHKATLFIA
jgi:predicted RNase H-like HicB family nuclease